MNDFELESKLKSVRVPERTEEYWEDFPRAGARAIAPRAPGMPTLANSWLPQLAWRRGFALAWSLVLLVFSPAVQGGFAAPLSKQEHHFRSNSRD